MNKFYKPTAFSAIALKLNLKVFFALALSLFFCLGISSRQAISAPIVFCVDPDLPTVQGFDAAAWTPATPSALLSMSGFTVVGATSITWNSDNLEFYAIVKTISPTARHLARVDPFTGVCTHIGALSSTAFSSMTYNSDLGIMYLMGGSGGPIGVAECLFSVDLTTAATTFLAGPFPVGTFGEVIAYNYDDDMIYHWSGEAPGAAMEKISPVTFTATPIVPSGIPHSEIQGAVYVGGGSFVATDLLFATGVTTSFTISATGFATLIGPTPFQARGLAYIDPLLPVELASFTSSVTNNNVKLMWSTVTELNNSGFDIERSSANLSWTKIDNVPGNGTTSQPMNYSYTDVNLPTGSYNYRLKQIDINGNFEYFNLVNEVVIGIPEKHQLLQNYPNPFNPSTSIDFRLPYGGNVKIEVFDNSGRQVSVLLDEFKSAGYYSVRFDASALSSGTYYYKLNAGIFSEVKKMIVLK